ncbi:uncharacterized protein BROUX77_006863 [Berkeleyomyces rouxiae]|uniref:uncharacterized protein n=1 Tax=Berkeleyomyces rouxiae TaxID=2035830 RepID=UPI003B8258EF
MREARDKTRERLGDLTLRAAYVKEQKAMQWAVVQAKRALMSKIINGFNETRDVFRAIKWANDKTDRRIPLLQRPDGSEWRFQEPNPDAIEWPPLSSDEVKAAIWKPANTAPGADRIPNEVWKRAWKPLGNLITGLYNLCLDSGHHPSTFKKADLVAIPKPGRPRQAPRSYRLISLLPTLGKGLERAVARRLAEESIERETIPRNYICAVPKRAVTDMLIELRGRIEDAQDWKKVTSIFTFDIKGAFDAVDPARMEHRLIENRWPTKLCRWVRSFMEDRAASMRTEGGVATTLVGGSLPQGSPVSPVLYMLFMAPLYKKNPALLGYADDGSLVVSGPAFSKNCEVIQILMREVLRWTANNGLEIDPGKSTLLHVKSRRKVAGNPSVTVEGLGMIKPTPANTSMRWLGLHLNAKLLFDKHIAHVTADINRVANGLRYLAGCYKGADTKSMLHAKMKRDERRYDGTDSTTSIYFEGRSTIQWW